MPSQQNTPPATVNPQDRHYSLGTHGFVHTSHGLVSPPTARQPAVVLLSACGRPFRLLAADMDLSVGAAVVGPQVLRALEATGVELLSFHIAPAHPLFPAISQTFRGDVCALNRDRFSQWNTLMRAAVWGEASLASVSDLFDQVVMGVLTDHRLVGELDPRLATVVELLDINLDKPIELLAREVNMTPHGLSRQFIDQFGLTLRAYQGWRRTAIAWELFAREKKLSLTEVAHLAGYSDSAHLSRTWRAVYGLSPSFMRSGSVQVIR